MHINLVANGGVGNQWIPNENYSLVGDRKQRMNPKKHKKKRETFTVV